MCLPKFDISFGYLCIVALPRGRFFFVGVPPLPQPVVFVCDIMKRLSISSSFVRGWRLCGLVVQFPIGSINLLLLREAVGWGLFCRATLPPRLILGGFSLMLLFPVGLYEKRVVILCSTRFPSNPTKCCLRYPMLWSRFGLPGEIRELWGMLALLGRFKFFRGFLIPLHLLRLMLMLAGLRGLIGVLLGRLCEGRVVGFLLLRNTQLRLLMLHLRKLWRCYVDVSWVPHWVLAQLYWNRTLGSLSRVFLIFLSLPVGRLSLFWLRSSRRVGLFRTASGLRFLDQAIWRWILLRCVGLQRCAMAFGSTCPHFCWCMCRIGMGFHVHIDLVSGVWGDTQLGCSVLWLYPISLFWLSCTSLGVCLLQGFLVPIGFLPLECSSLFSKKKKFFMDMKKSEVSHTLKPDNPYFDHY